RRIASTNNWTTRSHLSTGIVTPPSIERNGTRGSVQRLQSLTPSSYLLLPGGPARCRCVPFCTTLGRQLGSHTRSESCRCLPLAQQYVTGTSPDGYSLLWLFTISSQLCSARPGSAGPDGALPPAVGTRSIRACRRRAGGAAGHRGDALSPPPVRQLRESSSRGGARRNPRGGKCRASGSSWGRRLAQVDIKRLRSADHVAVQPRLVRVAVLLRN